MRVSGKWAALLAAMTLGSGAPVAYADDGCTVALCLAGNWQDITECVPPVRRALRNAAMGRPMPPCRKSSGPSSDESSGMEVTTISATARNCPAAARRGRNCLYDGALRVQVDGETWSNLWFDDEGNTATQNCGRAPVEASPIPATLESLLAEAQQLNTFEQAAAAAAASASPSAQAGCTADECGPLGVSRPPLAADANCAAPPRPPVEDDGRELADLR